MTQAPLAECRQVEVTYGRGDTSVRALDGVSFSVTPGERVALVGRSGSGKTTLIHVLGGLVEPTNGEIVWQGQSLNSIDRAARGAERARGIAFVFQGANLLPYFSVLENIVFAARVADDDADVENARRLIALVGLTAKAEHLPAELSGGEAQRVAIARALAQEPRLLLLDEPTGHLDSDTSGRVLDLIDRLQERKPFALVVATHAADVARRYDRTVALADGRVAAETPQ